MALSTTGSNTPKVATTSAAGGVPSEAARPQTYPSKKPSPSAATRSLAARDHHPWVAIGSSASRNRRADESGTAGAGMGVAGVVMKMDTMSS